MFEFNLSDYIDKKFITFTNIDYNVLYVVIIYFTFVFGYMLVSRNKTYSNNPISRIGSFVHAVLVSYLSIYLLIFDSNKLTLYPPDIDNYYYNLMFASTVYYLFFDFIFMCLFPTTNDMAWLLHHIIGFSGIFLIWRGPKIWLAGIFFELTELSTVFLNITWLHIKLNITNTLTFKIFTACLILAFFSIRIIGGGFFFLYIYKHINEIMLWDMISKLYILIAPIIIFSLNCYWFYKLIAAAFDKIKTINNIKDKID